MTLFSITFVWLGSIAQHLMRVVSGWAFGVSKVIESLILLVYSATSTEGRQLDPTSLEQLKSIRNWLAARLALAGSGAFTALFIFESAFTLQISAGLPPEIASALQAAYFLIGLVAIIFIALLFYVADAAIENSKFLFALTCRAFQLPAHALHGIASSVPIPPPKNLRVVG